MENTYKPKLIILSIDDLIKEISIKAGSGSGTFPSCNISYVDEYSCGVYANASEIPEGGVAIPPTCLDVGPLLGCNDDAYCSGVIPILR